MVQEYTTTTATASPSPPSSPEIMGFVARYLNSTPSLWGKMPGKKKSVQTAVLRLLGDHPPPSSSPKALYPYLIGLLHRAHLDASAPMYPHAIEIRVRTFFRSPTGVSPRMVREAVSSLGGGSVPTPTSVAHWCYLRHSGGGKKKEDDVALLYNRTRVDPSYQSRCRMVSVAKVLVDLGVDGEDFETYCHELNVKPESIVPRPRPSAPPRGSKRPRSGPKPGS